MMPLGPDRTAAAWEEATVSKNVQQQQGPAWGDVHDYTEDLRARFSVVVVFRVVFYPEGKSARRLATVVAEARASVAVNAEIRAQVHTQFRGNGGTATMPAAMWLACTELDGKLQGIEKVSQAKMAF
jgi:hypothetical protein